MAGPGIPGSAIRLSDCLCDACALIRHLPGRGSRSEKVAEPVQILWFLALIAGLLTKSSKICTGSGNFPADAP